MVVVVRLALLQQCWQGCIQMVAIDTEFQSFMLAERASYQKKHAWIVLLGPLVTVPLTASLLWPRFSLLSIGIWVLLSFVIFFAGGVSHSYFRKRLPLLVNNPTEQQKTAEKWRRNAVIGSLFMGVSWGIVPWIFYDPDQVYLVMIFCVYAAYLSSSVVVSSAYAPVFISFALGISTPFAVKMFYEFSAFSSLIFFLICSLTAVLCFMSINFHRLFEQAGRDRFDNQKLVREMKEKNKTVLEAINSKNSFLAAASHDLRQPLNAISLFVDALRPHLEQENGRQILKKIRLSLNGLNDMMHSILDISKLDADAIENNPVPIDLQRFVQALCDEYQAKTGAVKLINLIDHNRTTFLDATILHRVLGNLLDNAVKYTVEGHVSISLDALDGTDNSKAIFMLKIQDTGIGIAEDQLDSIFDEFYQLNNPERSQAKGLGLGLSIVRRLCDVIEVPLAMQSVENQGTLVSLQLPAIEQANIEQSLNMPKTKSLEPHSVTQNSLIAVIDDDPSTLDSMQLALESLGYQVVIGKDAHQVQQALTRLSAEPDLLISDLRLQDNQSGVDAIHQLRTQYRSTLPALLITGDTAPDRISLARRSNLSILYKPVDSIVLGEQVAELLGSQITS